MTFISRNISSGGPFSAVTPYLGESDKKVGDTPPATELPQDGFDRSAGGAHESVPSQPDSGQSSTPGSEFQRGAVRSGLGAALGAFPQVVHLLVSPEHGWAENLSKEMGLPVVSLTDGSVEGLQSELSKPEYSEGFILEGFPANEQVAQDLDSMLGEVAQGDRRVLSWDLANEKHQAVIDHYVDKDILWMVPESGDPSDAQEAKHNLLSCLQGLPAIQ